MNIGICRCIYVYISIGYTERLWAHLHVKRHLCVYVCVCVCVRVWREGEREKERERKRAERFFEDSAAKKSRLYCAVMPPLCIYKWGHVTHEHDSCHTWEWHVRHDSLLCVTWLIHKSTMTHSYHMCVTFSCVTWLIVMCDMTHSWVHRTTAFHEEMNESCHTWGWVVSHVWMSHVTYLNESCHILEWVMSQMRTSHVTRVNVSCHTCECVMSHMRMSSVMHPVEASVHCNTLQHSAAHCSTLQHTATHCNTLQQHTATHCNTLQHTATPSWGLRI